MKRYITILMFFALTIPTARIFAADDPENTAGYLQEQAENMVVIVSNPKTPKILSTNILSLEQPNGSSIDLNNAMIYWEIDGKWSESGKGLIKYSLKIGPYTNQIKVRARIKYENDYNAGTGKMTYYDAQTFIKPGIPTREKNDTSAFGTGDANEKLMPMVKSDKLEIITIPASPRAFQRVEFQAVPKKGNDCNIAEENFQWLVDGKIAEENLGQDRFLIRLVGPSGSTEVSVDAGSCGVAYINLIPKSDSRYYLQQNTATQVINCASQYAMMLDSSIKSIDREIGRFLETSDKAIDNIGKDITFIGETIQDLDQDWQATKEMFTKVKDAFESPSLKSIASGLKSLTNFVLRNPFSQRVEYIRRQIDYYNDLINWYNSYQYRFQAQLDSIRNREKTQRERCIEISQRKFDLNLRNVSEINDFKKYEW